MMLAQPFTRNRAVLSALAILGTTLGTVSTVYAGFHLGSAFHGLLQMDTFSVFFHLLIGVVAVLVVLASVPYLDVSQIPS